MTFIVTKAPSSLSFLIGYQCNSKTKDHFIRHLGYRFAKSCDMLRLNNADKTNEMVIDIVDGSVNQRSIESNEALNIVNEYWGDYGYNLEVTRGCIFRDISEVYVFASDVEAHEWARDNGL